MGIGEDRGKGMGEGRKGKGRGNKGEGKGRGKRVGGCSPEYPLTYVMVLILKLENT